MLHSYIHTVKHTNGNWKRAISLHIFNFTCCLRQFAKQMNRVTPTAIYQRPSSRRCSKNYHFEPQVPFRANNAFSGRELSYFGIEYPFGPYPFGYIVPFWIRIPFWAHESPFGPGMPSLVRDSFAGLELARVINALLFCACRESLSEPFVRQ